MKLFVFIVLCLTTSVVMAGGTAEFRKGTGGGTVEFRKGSGGGTAVLSPGLTPPTSLAFTATSSDTASLSWTGSGLTPSATNYEARISSFSDFSQLVKSSDTAGTSASFTVLSPTTTYFARVRATSNLNNPSTWSGTISTVTSAIPATLALVQSSCTIAVNGDPMSVTFNNSVVVGNSIIVAWITTGESPSTVTDNKSNQYIQRSLNDGAGSMVAIYASTVVATAGASFTITADAAGASATQNMCAMEVSGVTVYDQQNNGTGSGTDVGSGNVTTTGSAFWVGVMVHESGGSPTMTEDGGWTLVGEYEESALAMPISTIYKIQGAATDAAGWTLGVSATWRAAVATFN